MMTDMCNQIIVMLFYYFLLFLLLYSRKVWREECLVNLLFQEFGRKKFSKSIDQPKGYQW